MIDNPSNLCKQAHAKKSISDRPCQPGKHHWVSARCQASHQRSPRKWPGLKWCPEALGHRPANLLGNHSEGHQSVKMMFRFKDISTVEANAWEISPQH